MTQVKGTLGRKKIWFYFGLVFFSLMFCLILAESGMRIYHILNKKHRYIHLPDYYLGHTLAKNNRFEWWGNDEHPEFHTTQKTNSFGLVGKEISLKKPPKTYRILIMGDSFTAAFEVDEENKFTSQLETLLNNHATQSNVKFEVLNAGVRGYSPIVHYLRFKRDLFRLYPDLLIVQLAGNDVFEDNLVTSKSILDKNKLPVKINLFFTKSKWSFGPIPPLLLKIHNKIIEKSRLYEYFYLHIVKRGKNSPYNKKMLDLPPYRVGNQFFILQEQNPGINFGDPFFRDSCWQKTQHYLLALKKLASQQGADFMLLYIPIEAQLDLEQFGANSSMFFSFQADNYFNKILKEFCEENNIPLVDTLPNFEENKRKSLFFSWDGHITEQGHAVTSQALFEALKDKL